MSITSQHTQEHLLLTRHCSVLHGCCIGHCPRELLSRQRLLKEMLLSPLDQTQFSVLCS